MTFKELLDTWQTAGHVERTDTEYRFRLVLEDAARVEALLEMFPALSREQIITDLLHVALGELEQSMPYVEGNTVIREDEFGDPIYADEGPTPRFIELTHRHLEALSGGKGR